MAGNENSLLTSVMPLTTFFIIWNAYAARVCLVLNINSRAQKLKVMVKNMSLYYSFHTNADHLSVIEMHLSRPNTRTKADHETILGQYHILLKVP